MSGLPTLAIAGGVATITLQRPAQRNRLHREDLLTLQSRENHEAGLPLATMWFESRGMLEDRVFGALETIFHEPYHQRHLLGTTQLLGDDADGLRCETSYLVVRTRRDAMPEILSVGRYLDRIVRTPEGLRIAERLAIFDNDLVANAIIDPL